MEREVKQQEEDIKKLRDEIKLRHEKLQKELSQLKYNALVCLLRRIADNNEENLSAKHEKKLCQLYGGRLFRKIEHEPLINLTDEEIEQDIRDIFALGMNCHIKSKVNNNTTKIEIEKFFSNIKRLEKEKKLNILNEEKLTCDLKRFGLKERKNYCTDIITKEQYSKIKQFNQKSHLIVRKADKNNTFVVMNKNQYETKIAELISDPLKFKQIPSDPSDTIKKEVNLLITKANKNSFNFPKIIGHHEPGYIYGNPKTHKNKDNPPLRPIISQIGTVTYDLAKKLNNLITPYMPKKYMIESTHEFVQIAKTVTAPKLLASLDVESLFTNVPVDDTIQIILKNVYNHPFLKPPSFDQSILGQLLKISTTKTPFKSPSGDIFQQIDGVSMGTPLGPTFANFYMCNLENQTFMDTPSNKPTIYSRYVDDIFLVVDNFKEIEILKNALEHRSKLTFTYEIETCKQISFLDTLVTRENTQLSTTVHRKSTNTGECLNYNSICPERYKTSVIKNFLHRAYSICSSWQNFSVEINRIKQILVNNNFPNSLLDKIIKQFVDNKHKRNNNNNGTDNNSSRTGDSNNDSSNNDNTNINNDSIKDKLPTTTRITQLTATNLYFKNQMTPNYKQTENEIKHILNSNTTAAKDNIKLLIYYKNKKVRNLFIRNNCNTHRQEHNVVYEYVCNEEHCSAVHTSYIGHTTTTIKERFKQHTSIKKHFRDTHNKNITGSQMTPNVKIITACHNKEDLILLEALLIKEHRPIINTQADDFNKILKIFK